jgi:hypothetical protein
LYQEAAQVLIFMSFWVLMVTPDIPIYLHSVFLPPSQQAKMTSTLQGLCITKISDNIGFYSANITDQHLDYLYITSPFYGVPNSLLQAILDRVAEKKKLTLHNLLLFLSGNISEISLR